MKKKVTLSRKRCPARGVTVTVVTAAMPMVFESTLTFPLSFFFFCFFSGSAYILRLGLSVVRLGLGHNFS